MNDCTYKTYVDSTCRDFLKTYTVKARCYQRAIDKIRLLVHKEYPSLWDCHFVRL